MASSASPAQSAHPSRKHRTMFGGLILGLFGALSPLAAQGTVFDVTAHGVVARSSSGLVTDAGPAVRTLLTAISQGTGPAAGMPGPFTLHFPGGGGGPTIYDFTTTAAVSGYTAHLLISRSVTISTSPLDDLTLIGDVANTVELRFHDVTKAGFMINGGRRIRVSDLTMKYDVPPYVQGVIDALGQNDATSSWVEFTVDPGYPLPVLNATPVDPYISKPTYFAPYDAVTRLMHEGGEHLKFQTTGNFVVGGGWVQKPDPANKPRTYRVLIGKTVFNSAATGGAFANVGDLCAWKCALGVSVTTRETENCVLERLVVKNSGSGGFFSAMDANITYRDNRLIPDGTALLSSNLDGIHSKDNRGGPRIERCTFERTGDDCVAISGTWQEAVAAPPGLNYAGLTNPVYFRSRIRLQFRLAASEYAFDVFDGAGTSTPRFVRIAEGIYPNGIHYAGSYASGGVTYHVHEVGFAGGTAPTIFPGDIAICKNFMARGYSIIDCTMRDHRARAIFVKAPDGVVRGNRMENSGGVAILAGPEIGPFYEASFIEGITIEGNRMRNVHRCWGTAPTAGAISVTTTGASAPGAPFQFENLARNNRKIVIRDNQVTRSGRAGLFVAAAADVYVLENRFVGCQYLPFGSGGVSGYGFGIDDVTALIHLQNDENVFLRGNLVEASAAPYHEVLHQSAACTSINTESVDLAWYAGFEIHESDEPPQPFDLPVATNPEGPADVRLHNGVYVAFAGFDTIDDDPTGIAIRTIGRRSAAASRPKSTLKLQTNGFRAVEFAFGADVLDGAHPVLVYADPLVGPPVLLGVFSNDPQTLTGATAPFWTTQTLVLPWDNSTTPSTLRFLYGGDGGGTRVFLDDIVLKL